MKGVRSVSLQLAALALVCGVMFAQNSTAPSDAARVLVQAKKIYLVSGHVKYYKTKGFKTRLVEDSPFEEFSHEELQKWGRFQVVEDPKSADLLLRIYETSSTHPIPVGAVNSGGTAVMILDVVQPGTRNILWYTTKISGLSWSTKTAVSAVFKNLREYVETQESAARAAAPTSAPSVLKPVAATSPQQ